MAAAEVEATIIEALEDQAAPLSTEEVAEAVGLTRHTVSKYLQILHARDEVHLRRVGNAKLWSKPGETLRVLPLRLEDIDHVVKIENRLQDQRGIDDDPAELEAHLESFSETLRHHLDRAETGHSICLKAEWKEDRSIVGFIIGEVRMWEFGATEKTAWIEIMAVDPDHQRRGVGHRLGESILEEFRGRGVRRIRTLVDAYAGELIAYFRGLDFDIVPMLSMERSLSGD